MKCKRCLCEEIVYLGIWEDEPGLFIEEFQCECCLHTMQFDIPAEKAGQLADDPEDYERKA